MNSLLQNIYWKAPNTVKNIMASLNSRILERQRFGKDYEKRLIEIAGRDTWRYASVYGLPATRAVSAYEVMPQPGCRSIANSLTTRV